MPNPQGELIHQFLTQHPIGRAIAQHAKYGPGHPVHDTHAQSGAAGASAPLQNISPTLARTAHGPINPALMRQLMASGPGAGGPGAPPLPMPGGQGPSMPSGPSPQMPGQGMPGA